MFTDMEIWVEVRRRVLAGEIGKREACREYGLHWDTLKKIKLSDQFYGEGANIGDFNHDGKADIVSGPYWYEGPDFSPDKKHAYYDAKPFDPKGYSKNFFAFRSSSRRRFSSGSFQTGAPFQTSRSKATYSAGISAANRRIRLSAGCSRSWSASNSSTPFCAMMISPSSADSGGSNAPTSDSSGK